MPKATINLSPPLMLVQAEAAAMGISFPALLTADLVRYRALAVAATPQLTRWQWNLLDHVMSGIEAHRILSGIDEWADGAIDDDALRAGELRRQVMTWTPLTVAAALLHLRGEAMR